jgi:hypothetical protein
VQNAEFKAQYQKKKNREKEREEIGERQREGCTNKQISLH